MIRTILSAAAVLAGACSVALSFQPTSTGPLAPPPNGPRRADPTWSVITDCTLHARPGESLEHATIVIRDGRVAAVLPPEPAGAGGEGEMRPARTPIGPRVFDAKGLHVYAGFIDAHVEVAAPAPAPDSPGLHWNTNVTPQRSALDGPGLDERTAESLRKIGFTAAAITPQGGIFRGRAAVVSLAKAPEDRSAGRPPVYASDVYQSVSFRAEGRGYPGSQMGSIALIRQTLADADWRATNHDGVENCLDWLAPGGDAPGLYLFDTDDELEAIRAMKIAREFQRPAALLGCGTEFRRLDAVKADNAPIILPLNFPRTPDVSSVSKTDSVELRELMTWEQAPTNPRRLVGAGLTVALTTSKLRDRAEFMKNLRAAIKHGLPEDAALAAITTTPADLLGLSGQLGTVEAGKRANLLVTDGPVFADKTKVRAVWIDGIPHEIETPGTKLEGVWTVTIPGAPEAQRSIVVDKDNGITVKRNDKTVKAQKVTVDRSRVSYVFDHEPLDGQKGIYVMNAAIERGEDGSPARLIGQGIRATGDRFTWSAERQPPSPAIGVWKVTRADDEIKDENADDGLTIRITADSVTLDFGKQKPRGDAKDEPEKKADDEAQPEEKPEEKTDEKEGDKPEEGRRSRSENLVIKADDVKVEGGTVTFTHDLSKLGMEGKSSDVITVTGDTLTGESTLPDGSKHSYAAARQKDDADDKKKREEELARIKEIPETYGTPFGPYGLTEIPPQETLVIRNATIWTSGPKGKVEKGTLIVDKGRIVGVYGEKESLPKMPGEGLRDIDAAGAHITPGLIDCHSHTGISGGVNEGGQAVTAEVRIADVTNPDDVNWYRQLAGGITAVNNLHGSANAIGGQSQTNKLRWGAAKPDDMHFEGAKPGIKFALGENPRQVNSGGRRDPATPARYPQTRMGVETLIRDRFTVAKEYTGKGRRDLELEAIAEILRGERLVHCHSYRQDEIVMLAMVARDFGFKIGTYQHILEGYKVADYVRDYSGGGSCFSDWWAYKVEVQDAIPEAGAIMHEVGVVVSFNSDSNELARRMNVEAAKAVKYGGLSEEDALNFVTLNPAKQLQVDSRVGSLEPGKDADFVIWSGHPLSVFTKAQATYIDGRCYFSLEQDAKHRETIAKERTRLIQKILAENRAGGGAGSRDDSPAGGPAGRRRGPRPPSITLEEQERYLDMLRSGRDPLDAPGVCGCGFLH